MDESVAQLLFSLFFLLIIYFAQQQSAQSRLVIIQFAYLLPSRIQVHLPLACYRMGLSNNICAVSNSPYYARRKMQNCCPGISNLDRPDLCILNLASYFDKLRQDIFFIFGRSYYSAFHKSWPL